LDRRQIPKHTAAAALVTVEHRVTRLARWR
jgi:hypothetical protein